MSTPLQASQTKVQTAPSRVPLSADEPETLVDLYERVARLHPKPNTLNYKRDGAWHSFSAEQMIEHARHIALGLYSLGIRKGDRVALLSDSRVEWVLADQGCIFAGAITVADAREEIGDRVLCEAEAEVGRGLPHEVRARCADLVVEVGEEEALRLDAIEDL